MENPLPSIAVFGPGLMGGSLLMALRQRSPQTKLGAWARRTGAIEEVRARGLIDFGGTDAASVAAHSDLAVLCLPVDRLLEVAEAIKDALPPHAVITDVGSVKGELCRACHAALAPRAHFIGAHPMAGSEKTGWENATPTLFEKRVCFVTPLDGADETAVTTVANFWSGLGSEVTTLSPDQHDEITAHVSHLPQLVATSLATFLATKNPQWRNLSGNGLRDTTRIAASDATMWIEIFQQNRDEVLRAMRQFQDELQGFQTALANRDWPEVRTRLERGKAWRAGFRP